VFWVLGVGSFLLLEPMLLFLAPDTPAASRFANEEERRYITSRTAGKHDVVYGERSVGLGSLLKDFRFWMVTICHVGTVATLFGLATWIPTYLTQFRGLPFSALGGWVAWTYWIPVPVAILAGYFADRSMRPALVGSATGAVVAVMVLTAVLVPSTVASVLLLATTLASPVIYGALNASIMQRMALPGQIGRATGIFVGLSNLVGGLSPTVIGYLIGHFGGRYLAAFGFISAVNFMLVFLYLPLDRSDKPGAP
jgi:sugar phosphate permease